MLKAIRWLLFIPAAFVASVLASVLKNLAGSQISEFIGFALSGVMAAIGFIIAGLWVAPRRGTLAKWTLIAISSVLGLLSAAGSTFGDDKLKVTTGICMVIASLALAKASPDEITGGA